MRRLRATTTTTTLLAVALAACGPAQPSLSDAALIWCEDVAHYPALKHAADVLGIEQATLITVELAGAGKLGASAAEKADYARACTAAFESR